MDETKYFRNPLSAYTHQYAIGMQQMHEAVVSRSKGDMQAFYPQLQKAQETFVMVDRLWDCMSDEDQQFFYKIMGEDESAHG